ncbi:ARG81-transcription factor involved in arginine metabolism [Fusarium albosuccineum]|uniref:ARG81-transcription factor involved in arginine metabolism n=1 Tax=Fusarium albosuccineum TaxID=1237068 RepID=A0A8H4LIK6_9HYPO|nr:ARG81-transcription factor involved in arginine metabolism [Fusarium albosuccineum]
MASSTGKATGRAHGRRSRSFGGCVTCRSRRMKCDEGRPTCTMCKVSGFACGGYTKDIFFDFEDDPLTGVARFRRPLLTERERKCMSESILSDIPPALATWHLSQLDDECDRISPSRDIQLSRGPFGAFRITGQHSGSDTTHELAPLPEAQEELDLQQDHGALQLDDDTIPLDQDGDLEFVSPSIEITTLPSATSRLGPSHLDHSSALSRTDWLKFLDGLPVGNWLDMTGVDVPDWWNSMGIDSSGFVPNTADNRPTPASQQASVSTSQRLDHLQLSRTMHTDSPSHCVSTPSSGSISLQMDTNVPRDAVFLLKHYGTTVLRGLTPYRHSKTPWHILFLPHVKSCLAALTLGEDMDHASLCAFFGTLAISAFSLGGIYSSAKWLDQGKTYHQRAHFHVRMMLETAYHIPKTAKYKSILMALLTMVQISILSGNRDEAEYYFLETEKFIRLRGLNRRKSRKVRLLHHCYVFERLSHESTFTESRFNLAHRSQVRAAIESSDAVGYSHDSLSFRLSNWSNLDQEMLKVKCQEEGENDLHLQCPGIWSATLYPEIFGMPELHLFMLSLIIRLGREKDGDHEQPVPPGVALKQFLGRAKAVERWVNQLHMLQRSIWIVEAPADPEHEQSVVLLNCLSDTMQHALAVYFYRRIYDLDSGMLQKHVLAVRDCLLRFDASDAGMGYGSLRLIWPAFIAACETDDADVRASFSQWFEDSSRRSGLRIFAETKERIERVWEEREHANGSAVL